MAIESLFRTSEPENEMCDFEMVSDCVKKNEKKKLAIHLCLCCRNIYFSNRCTGPLRMELSKELISVIEMNWIDPIKM